MSDFLSAVVVAAGQSRRMGFDKLMTPLAGQPLLMHTLERMQKSLLVKEIVLVVRPDAQEEVNALVGPLRKTCQIRLVHGGAQRQDSVQAGLKAVTGESDYVMIQDAARPCITPDLIERVFEAAKVEGAAVCGLPASDTLKEVTENGVVYQTLDRSKIWAVQTPQIFRKKLLLEAYAAVAKNGEHVTDDTAAVEKFGNPVRVVLHHGVNLKVTTPSDWKLAESYLAMGEPETAQGVQLRNLMHELNNHLTPLLGYAYLIGNEFETGSKGKKYSDSIHHAAEKCHQTALQIQKILRDLFPRKDSGMPSNDTAPIQTLPPTPKG
jgi:2-C-methyl-D-erythritol 4-phosphate cytidylyltransferase